VVLDPVYTGKAMYGLISELRRDARAFGDTVVFLHTGGIFGLFGGDGSGKSPFADLLDPGPSPSGKEAREDRQT
jgi:hypothetical protein